MSGLQAKLSAVRFEPVQKHTPHPPGDLMLLFGVLLPAAAIVIEALGHACAQTLFDPMPTYWHVAAVSLVPASNLLVWAHLRNGTPPRATWLAFANGGAIAIAAFYALLFLPVLPIALVAVIVLVGVPPLTPLFSLVVALKLRRALRERHMDQRLGGALLAGLGAGIALLLVLDIPAAATKLGIQWAASSAPSQRERGLTLLRTVGDDDLLLGLCYGATGRPTGLLSALVSFGGIWLDPRQHQIATSAAEAREIYYRVHGVPFNSRPAPALNERARRFADFQFDNDHGGAQVGGRLKGLSMVSSRIDGSLSADDALAYLEWTVELRNSEPIDREARLQLALPPGGVVSRATLWVNGEEREAAYGGRGEVRAAYQRVAVQQRRDPLLVTSKGADRVLAQAFPVPRNGGTLKFKIGMTAPVEIVEASKARLTLPAIVDRNFSFAADTRHSIWIESKQALATSAAALTASRIDAGLFRISGALSDRELARMRPTITIDRNPAIVSRTARFGGGATIVQEIVHEIVRSGASAPTAMILVIDGSAGLVTQADSLIESLDAIAPGGKVGVIIAAEPMRQVPLAPWSDAHKRAVTTLVRTAVFVGGQDNAPALAQALQMLEAEPNATLLWLHGRQPVEFRDSGALLEQAGGRLSRLPRLILYAAEPGPNEVLPDAPWAWSARSLPATGDVAADLGGFFRRQSGDTFVIRRTQSPAGKDQPSEGVGLGSDHIARLWAGDRVLELMRMNPAANRAAAVALASEHRLVTPVSGAVVLETQQQYDESRLTPVSQATVPTVPEPHEWALLLIAGAALAWFGLRNRQRLAVAA